MSVGKIFGYVAIVSVDNIRFSGCQVTSMDSCRRVSDVAQHALQHFQGKQSQSEEMYVHGPEQLAQHAEVLTSLLLWLASYRQSAPTCFPEPHRCSIAQRRI